MTLVDKFNLVWMIIKLTIIALALGASLYLFVRNRVRRIRKGGSNGSRRLQVSGFPAYDDMTPKQKHTLQRVWIEANRTAEAQSDGQSFYKLYYVEVEELRYDEEADELVPTGVYLTLNGPNESHD